MKNCHSNGLYINNLSLRIFTLPDNGFVQKSKHVAIKQYKNSCVDGFNRHTSIHPSSRTSQERVGTRKGGGQTYDKIRANTVLRFHKAAPTVAKFKILTRYKTKQKPTEVCGCQCSVWRNRSSISQ